MDEPHRREWKQSCAQLAALQARGGSGLGPGWASEEGDRIHSGSVLKGVSTGRPAGDVDAKERGRWDSCLVLGPHT